MGGVCTHPWKDWVVTANLTAQDLFGAVVDDLEENPGAYVHFNVDNDDSSDNSLPADPPGKYPGGDFAQDGPVQGEDDLKGLQMQLTPLPDCGVVTLAVSSANGKVWRDPLKGLANLVLAGPGARSWDLAVSGQRSEFLSWSGSLQVEGVGAGTCWVTLTYKWHERTAFDAVKYTFIAATCGRQPRTDNGERASWESGNPGGLKRCEWSIVAPASDVYNCIAWSVDDPDRWYEKVQPPPAVDQPENGGNGNGRLDESDMDGFYLLKKTWTPTASGALDAQAMYYATFHAARFHACGCGAGKWIMYRSKCGDGPRIEHVWDQLTGYGSPYRFYK
jgi:hypothetical protein